MEEELKLAPLEPALLQRLAEVSRLGSFQVVGRRRERQRNSFFDTRESALRRARIGFRRRVVDRKPMATWTVKAEGTPVRGILSRPELEVQLSRDAAPLLVLSMLRQLARERGSPVLAAALADALSSGSQPLARPYLELETDRWMIELAAPAQGWQAELALDRVGMVGDARYEDREIEVELRKGDLSALEAARAAIEELGGVREAAGSKLTRALDYIERRAASSR